MLATNRCKNGPKSTIKQSLSPGQEKAVDDGRGYIGQYRQQLCSTIPFTTKSNKKRISRSNSELSQALTSPCFWNRLLAIHPVRLVTFLLSRAFHILIRLSYLESSIDIIICFKIANITVTTFRHHWRFTAIIAVMINLITECRWSLGRAAADLKLIWSRHKGGRPPS